MKKKTCRSFAWKLPNTFIWISVFLTVQNVLRISQDIFLSCDVLSPVVKPCTRPPARLNFMINNSFIRTPWMRNRGVLKEITAGSQFPSSQRELQKPCNFFICYQSKRSFWLHWFSIRLLIWILRTNDDGSYLSMSKVVVSQPQRNGCCMQQYY